MSQNEFQVNNLFDLPEDLSLAQLRILETSLLTLLKDVQSKAARKQESQGLQPELDPSGTTLVASVRSAE